MNRKIMLCVLSVLWVPSASVFAQFNVEAAAQSARNLANLERIIARASKGSAFGRPVIKELPPQVVPGQAAGLLRVKMPKAITPVSHSYAQYLRTTAAKYSPKLVAHKWVGFRGKHGLFENENELARYIDNFYQGKADIYKGPDGREVKLYMLPIDGLLYMPAGSAVPLVLNADEYFVAYDVQSKTGKILQNIPQVYGVYTRYAASELSEKLEDLYRRVKTAVATEEGLTRDLDREVADVLKHYPEEPVSRAISQAVGYSQRDVYRKVRSLVEPAFLQDDSIYRMEKAVNEADRASGYWQEIWNNKHLPYVFASGRELGRALSEIHMRFGAVVEDRATQEFYRVYELPVDGLSYQTADGTLVKLDPQHDVVLHESKNKFIVVDRATLENSGKFKFYSHYILN